MKNKTRTSFLTQIQENWKWIAVLLACGGAGFWQGKFYAEIELSTKILEKQLIIIELREKNLEQMEKFQNQIMDLKNENYKLQIKSYENEKSGKK